MKDHSKHHFQDIIMHITIEVCINFMPTEFASNFAVNFTLIKHFIPEVAKSIWCVLGRT